MSIVVSVKVGEGFVLATDSASTLHVQGAGQAQVAKIYTNATKLKQIKNYPIALAIWGAGNFGTRSVISLVEEFEEKELQSLADHNRTTADGKTVDVKPVTEAVMQYLLKAYREQLPGVEKLPKEGGGPEAGVAVGGFSSESFFASQYIFAIPEGQLMDARPDLPGGRPNFGANWYGLADAIVRLHFGRDDTVLDLMRGLGIQEETISKLDSTIKAQLQYPVNFDAMPLRDAIEYAEYLVSVVVGRFRFVLGAPLCGGPVDVLAISRSDGLRWVKRKSLSGREERHE